ncbi:MAG TPA: protein-L-isoaspartate(D-aspartate) O-methyltransferase, partial [Candidatus Omnitrophota bacterium]|nr:protein-L-isoaspartate(D-aspartate) O-methyltransferase [Candidatus Omnitrophota bacterium]
MMDKFSRQRAHMIESQIKGRGVLARDVLEVLADVPRHLFVPEELQKYAYDDHPVDIGYGQTVSQPYIVAFMTEILHLCATHRVLEIGTGSEYQTAVLSRLAAFVYTVEIVEPLSMKARAALTRLGHDNVAFRCGDGRLGWPQEAPFDAIMVTAAPVQIPSELCAQLKEGGRLVLPVGGADQELV